MEPEGGDGWRKKTGILRSLQNNVPPKAIKRIWEDGKVRVSTQEEFRKFWNDTIVGSKLYEPKDELGKGIVKIIERKNVDSIADIVSNLEEIVIEQGKKITALEKLIPKK